MPGTAHGRRAGAQHGAIRSDDGAHAPPRRSQPASSFGLRVIHGYALTLDVGLISRCQGEGGDEGKGIAQQGIEAMPAGFLGIRTQRSASWRGR